MKKTISLLVVILMLSSILQAQERKSAIYPFSLYYNPQRTLLRTFPAPAEYERFPMNKMNQYMAWISNLPLKEKNHPAAYWNKEIIFRADSINGVIDLGIATRNQKDSDLPLQLVMEYLDARSSLYNFPIIIGIGDTVTYTEWLNGKYSSRPNGKLVYKKGEKRPATIEEFYRYLEFTISRNETKSLLWNLNRIKETDIAPGDLFVLFHKQDEDSVGFAAIIFDVCANKEGELLLLAGWGGTPAQSLVVYRPWPVNKRQWFTIDELKNQLAQYGEGHFYRFANIEKAFE
jgi:hypothetical protein